MKECRNITEILSDAGASKKQVTGKQGGRAHCSLLAPAVTKIK